MTLNLEVLDWLLAGDSAVQFQVRRDLLGDERPDLQLRIPHDGDAAAILAAQRGDGHWGEGFYQPKWTCTHYSLLELRDLAVPSGHPSCVRAVSLLVGEKGADGGVNPSRSVKVADVCINGHFLAYASHFGVSTVEVASVVDFVLGQELPDGGFNCRSNRSGARNSSVHTTASVIDGSPVPAPGTLIARTGRWGHAAAAEALLSRRSTSDGQTERRFAPSSPGCTTRRAGTSTSYADSRSCRPPALRAIPVVQMPWPFLRGDDCRTDAGPARRSIRAEPTLHIHRPAARTGG